ncbi:2Fe-2S iron-sulfur cluster-binding protein [Desulfosporosinus meridiei]|uniref:NADH:ubiquinone oxidoreductase chain G-like protein n=1 Tax=Desulfosporosinus meridiei (strain ATCC BAA-275 / DSM 13257 / KCTC 12902 / NCIMB 13706 / S10) TaxID=768704 RepID=J7IQN6_DESMD|nr:2Fe-2S iron-sulfur cluster-binding protein [Desulfosporosinus meridiei]AFQ42489.1 NADH:ubiquinone oxidoreductase chain G-like protein [Desulfosporosinus meridiei DSM 13257]
MESLTLTIDGRKVSVPKGTTVLEACRLNNIPIPTLCHDPALTPSGACRLCVVQIEGMRNLSPSCAIQAAEGMKVETQNPKVRNARKTILNLLVANHPLDCMTCQKLGECSLADYAYEYGVNGKVYNGEKRRLPIDDTNPYILRDLNKCILCGKCVATCEEVAERSVISFANRGFETKISTFMDTDLKDSACVYCNRCVAICPVGALVDKSMVGKGRVWEFTTEEVTCTFCDYGCKFVINSKHGKVVGVIAKSAANGRPLCLKGRMGADFSYNPHRTELPFINQDGEFIQVSWAEFLGLGNILEKINMLEK